MSRASASASAPTASSSSRSDNLVEAIALGTPTSLCLGCFTREYPIDVQLPLDKFALERPEGMQTAMVFPRDAGLDPAKRRGGRCGEVPA